MSSSVAPGYTTTEFWQSMLAQALSLAIGLGVLIHAHFDLTGLQVLIPSVSVIAAAIASAVYSRSRATVKAAELAARS